MKCKTEGEKEDLEKMEVIFGCFIFFCMSVYTYLYIAMYYSMRLRKSGGERARDLCRIALILR
jgi:hypothetical protein